MSRNGSGVYSLPAVYEAVPGETILATQHNTPLEDLEADANTARPIVAGGTGATSAADARTNLGVYSTSETQGIVSTLRNRVVNPGMQVSLENGNNAGTTTGYYGADQWATHFVTSAGTITTQRVQSATPGGANYRYRVTITVADASLAAGEALYIRQPIEGNRVSDFLFGTASARQSLLRFGWKSPAGTYCVAIHNSASNRSFLAPFTISSGEANTDTVQAVTITGDTSGTWLTDTGVGLFLTFTIAAGTTFQGAAGWQAGSALGTSAITNGMGSAGSVYELFDVGLYVDPGSTGVAPTWSPNPEAIDQFECARYYQLTFTQWAGNTTSGVLYVGMGPIPVRLRTSPTFSGTNVNNPGFPTTVGTFGLANNGTVVGEQRTSNSTVNGGIFSSSVTINARF